MMFFPLVNILGYESSVINGILFFIFSEIRAIRNSSLNIISDENYGYHFRNNISFLSITFLTPLILGIFSTILFSECPLGDGILFYFVIAIPNIFFGYTIGLYISVLIQRFRYITFVTVFIIILLIPLLEFYLHPQVYFYNLIIGFFPGTIYDEDLTVDGLLLSYRILQLAFFIALLFISHRVHSRSIKKTSSLIIVLLAVTTFFFVKPFINYSTNLDRLKKSLKGTIQTEHFEILYSKSIDKNAALYLAQLHEYYYEQIIQNLEIGFDEKIISIVFRDENEKRKLIGAGRADIAKPWLMQIFLNYPTFDETLKHEIVHVIAGKFGTTPFKVAQNLNPAMIEGVAMAIENDYDGYSIHQMAKIAFNAGYKISIERLFSGLNFFSNYSSISYIYAGSFIKYLSDTYGINRIKQLYSDIDFYKYYEKDLSKLEEEYNLFLNNIRVDFNRNTAQLYFGGKTIFKKHCARTAAHKTKKAISLFQSGKYSEAEDAFLNVYNYSGSYQALSGLVNSSIKLKKYNSAEKYLLSEETNFMDSPYKYNVELLLGDVYVLNDKIDSARSFYDSLLVQNPSVEYYNETFIRNYLLTNNISELKNYILGDRKKRFELLKSLNADRIIYESIPMMIYYCNDNSELKNLILFLQNKLAVSDKITSYSAMKISQAAAKLGYYEIAQNIAVKSLSYKEDNLFLHPLTENLKLINWLVNFSEETLKKISIE